MLCSTVCKQEGFCLWLSTLLFKGLCVPFGKINWIIFQYISLREELIVLITDGGRVRGGSADGREGEETFKTTSKEGELIMLFAIILHVFLFTCLQCGPFLLWEREIKPV